MKYLQWITVVIITFTSLKGATQTMVVTDDPTYTVGHTSSVLDIKSNGKGLLPPRLSLLQRLGISNPSDGLMLYQTDSAKGYYYFNGTSWIPFASGTNTQWKNNGKKIYYDLGNVGIMANDPVSAFSVGKNSEFQVDTIGNIIKIKNVRTDWPSTQGAANTFLKNDGTGTLRWSAIFQFPSLTAGSVLFSDGTTIGQDNANFFWNNTLKRLGIGTNSPTNALHIRANNNPVRIEGLQNNNTIAMAFVVMDSITGVLYKQKSNLQLVGVTYLGRAIYYSDLPAISNNSNITQNVTVPGAQPGDIVVVTPTGPIGPSGCVIIGYSYVSAVNVVSIRFVNVSNTWVDPPLMGFYILLAR